MFEINHPVIYKLLTKVFLVIIVMALTGSNSSIYLDGESSSDEGDLTDSKPESSKANKNTSHTDTNSSDIDKNNSETTATYMKVSDESLSDKFEKMYLAMNSNENIMLTEEKNTYNETGTLPGENYHERMQEFRQNDPENLQNHLKLSDARSSTEDTGSTENKRQHEDSQEEMDKLRGDNIKKNQESNDK